MRVLFISAFYPPFEIGGWEQLTKEIGDRLQARGHEIRVLTSTFRKDGEITKEDRIWRLLRLVNNQYRYNPFLFFATHDLDRNYNFATLRKTITSFQPQAVMVHSMWNLSRSILWNAEQLLPNHVAYFLADYWPAEPDVDENFWMNQRNRESIFRWRYHLSKMVTERLKIEKEEYRLKFENTIFVSRAVQYYLEEAGFDWASRGRVIHNGIDLKKFSPGLPNSRTYEAGYLLFIGSLAPHKGLITVLNAFALLKSIPEMDSLKLLVAGGGHPEHVAQIEALIDEFNLSNRVILLGPIDRDHLPDLYRGAYALVFPSIWREPLARTTQEAMACGIPVIATLTGGTSELITDGINGLGFQPEDARELALQIQRLWSDPELAKKIAVAGRETIAQKFDIELTVTHFEKYLLNLIETTK